MLIALRTFLRYVYVSTIIAQLKTHLRLTLNYFYGTTGASDSQMVDCWKLKIAPTAQVTYVWLPVSIMLSFGAVRLASGCASMLTVVLSFSRLLFLVLSSDIHLVFNVL